MMKSEYLSYLDLRGMTIILRSDLNSDVKGKRVISSARIRKAASTISSLKKRGARVVILAHQGNLGKKDFVSLKQHAKHLSKYTKVSFVNDVIGLKAVKKIKNLKNGEALLLDNVRFVKDEFFPHKKNNRLLKVLAPLGDLYINDAFSVSHRDQTSLTGFPKVLSSFPGPLVLEELDALKSININKSLFIIGGGKPESGAKLLSKGKLLPTGLFAPLCLIALGKMKTNKTVFDLALIKNKKALLSKIKRYRKNVVLPVDLATEIKGKRVEFAVEDFPVDKPVIDIGSKTIRIYQKHIKKAKSIYMRGPAGLPGNKKAVKGTRKILKSIAQSKSFSLLGGGHLSDMIKSSRIPQNNFGHVSLSGGALLNFLIGNKLPGFKALGYYKK